MRANRTAHSRGAGVGTHARRRGSLLNNDGGRIRVCSGRIGRAERAAISGTPRAAGPGGGVGYSTRDDLHVSSDGKVDVPSQRRGGSLGELQQSDGGQLGCWEDSDKVRRGPFHELDSSGLTGDQRCLYPVSGPVSCALCALRCASWAEKVDADLRAIQPLEPRQWR